MRQALEMALEAFEEIAWSNSTDWQRDRAKVAITAIKEALAQPEQEPLCTAAMFDDAFLIKSGLSPHIKLYTAPLQPEQEPVAWREFLERVAKQKPEKPDYWSSCGQCERNINGAEDLLEATPPQRKPLTNEQIKEIGHSGHGADY